MKKGILALFSAIGLLLTAQPGLAQERAYILGVISYGNSAQMIAA
jgi:hypothetical protein